MNTEMALSEIKDANDTQVSDPENFEDDKESYERVLSEVDDIGGPDLVDALTGRLLQDIEAANERPGPTAVRRHAVDLCERNGIEIPASSELSGEDATGSDTGLGRGSL